MNVMQERCPTYPQMLQQVVAQRGTHTALITAGQQLSYAELDRQSAAMACALLAAGAGKGSRIALMAPDGVLWITTFLASLRIGALISVVSTLCTPSELLHILHNSDVQFLIAARGFLRHDYAKTLTAALPGIESCRVGAIAHPSAPYLRAVWLDDADQLPWANSVDELLAKTRQPGAPDVSLLHELEKNVVATDDAVIVYTSGSTSLPKAVVHTQQTLAQHPREVAKLFLLKPDDRMMPLLPAFWLGGMVMALEVFSVGATLVYPATPDHEVVLDTIEQFAVNRVNSWGDMLVKLREAAIARGMEVDAIVGLGPFRDQHGELIPPQLQSSQLGMSETFAVHSGEALDVRLPDSKAGAAGRSINGYERRVVSPDSGELVPAGEVGELQIRGGGLMSGFYKLPREQVFTEDGFYPTGDLVRIDEDGYLFFVARTGDMIKTRAANVSRLEVEAALRELPGIDTVVVTGLPDAELGQRVVAAIVPEAGKLLDEQALKTALRERLSSYKVPRNIVIVDEEDIPRTATGKVRLFAVADMIRARLPE